MSDQQTPEPQYAGVIRTKSDGHDLALSIDIINAGVLIVDQLGSVRLIPWHNINDVVFYDDSALTPAAEPYVPERHEGSE